MHWYASRIVRHVILEALYIHERFYEDSPGDVDSWVVQGRLAVRVHKSGRETIGTLHIPTGILALCK